MADISLTASMRSNLLSLQNTQSLMDMTQERLSTGKKVNSAIDNPSSYYTAASLNNRASDLNALLDSMVRLSGMTKQDYIIARLLKFEITVQGNPRVYKAMKQELAFLCARLSESGFLPDSDWAARLDHLLLLLDGMKEV